MEQPNLSFLSATWRKLFGILGLLGGALVASTSNAQPSPQPDISVAYDVSIFGGTTTAMEDGSFAISHGDGGAGIFSIRLRRSTAEARTMAMVRRPLGYDDDRLNASDVLSPEQEYGVSEEARATIQYQRLLGALRHHRPEVGLEADRGRRAHQRLSAPHVEFDRCGRSLLALNISAALAAEADRNERGNWRNRRARLGSLLRPQLREASILLELLTVPLARADGGYWTQFSQRRRAEQRAGRFNQFDWRDELVLTYGQEFRAEEEIRSGSRTPFGRACEVLHPPRLRNTVRDVCTLAIVFDQRDGWPIAASFNRIRTAQDSSTSSSGMIYWRLAPLRGYIPPPNPCPAA